MLRLKELRKARNETQADIAEVIGIIDVAKKIAGVLDFSWTRFYEEERENATRPSA